MTIEEVLVKYYGEEAQYVVGRLYRIGNKKVIYSLGKPSWVGNDKIEFIDGRLYKVGTNIVKYRRSTILSVGNVKIK